jgi:peptidoglycan-associated lipoprotein
MRKSIIFTAILGTIFLGSCMSAAEKYTKKADKKFNEKGEFMPAVELYQTALSKPGADKAKINYQIAESYRLSNKIAESGQYYSAAIESGNKREENYFYRALASKAQGNYEVAKQQMQEYLEKGKNPELIERAKLEVDNIDKIAALDAKKNTYQIKNMEVLNTAASEYSPILFQNDLYFSSSRGEGQTYLATGEGFTDIYKYKFDGISENSGTVSIMDKKINLPNAHEACAAFSPDGKVMVFARSNTGSRKGDFIKEVYLYATYYRNGEWTEPELMPGINTPDSWNSSPAFSADGNTLYFASNRKGGKGGIDIYSVKKDPNGRWSKVNNVSAINTVGDDMFPWVSEEGRLYFASDGHPGFGGLDIFEAVKTEDGVKIENMGKPINSSADDFGLIFKSPGEGYFASNREGGKGSDDIYYFNDKRVVIKNVTFILEGNTKGTDTKDKNYPLTDAKVTILGAGGSEVAKTTTDANGNFTAKLMPSTNYTFVIEKEGYFTKRDVFSTYGKKPSDDKLQEGDNEVKLSYETVLDKVEKNRTFVVDNIYYDYNKWDIRPDAEPELDKIVEMMKDNPDIKIELSSHTDTRGNDDANMKLSQKRAESAVNYIITKGKIEPTRIIAKGYGETVPRRLTANKGSFKEGDRITDSFIKALEDDNLKEEAHQLNRRTEFKIID